MLLASGPSDCTDFNLSPLLLTCPSDLTVQLEANACTATVLLNQPQIVSDACVGQSPSILTVSAMGIGTGPFAGVGPGVYKTKCLASNECGQKAMCYYFVTVRENQKPTIHLKTGIMANIKANGKAKCIARQFDHHTTDNCTPSNALRYAFSNNPTDTLRYFDCTQLGANNLSITVFDVSGNKSSGSTKIIIQDGSGFCPNSYAARLKKNPFQLNLANQTFEAGKTISVDFKLAQFDEDIEKFQFTLDYDMRQLSLISATTPQVSGTGFENMLLTHESDDQLTLTWDGQAAPISDEQTIFSTTFTTLSDGQLLDAFHISDQLAPAAAFDMSGNSYEIQLNITEQPHATNGFQLLQNHPNPFIEMTMLRFELPEASEIGIRIMDTNGNTVHTQSGTYPIGANNIVLHRTDIGEPGIYLLQMTTNYGTAFRKLLMF